MVKHVNKAEWEDAEHVYGEWDEKEEEIAIVSPTHTVVHPWTMMIEGLEEKNNRTSVSIWVKYNVKYIGWMTIGLKQNE